MLAKPVTVLEQDMPQERERERESESTMLSESRTNKPCLGKDFPTSVVSDFYRLLCLYCSWLFDKNSATSLQGWWNVDARLA